MRSVLRASVHGWLVGWLVVWLFDCLVVWLVGWLVVWLFGRLVGWLLQGTVWSMYDGCASLDASLHSFGLVHPCIQDQPYTLHPKP